MNAQQQTLNHDLLTETEFKEKEENPIENLEF
jgi:serine/threonine protein kinase